MVRICILLLLLTAFSNTYSQFSLDQNVIYGGNSTDEAKDLATSPSEAFFFFGGRTFSNDGDVPDNQGASDFWIMKRDKDGNLIWNFTYGGTSNDDLVTVMPHSDGGTLAFGTTATNQEFANLPGITGGWVMRASSSGVLIDGEIFGGTASEIAVDAYRRPLGEMTLLLESNSPIVDGQMNHGDQDAWIVHITPALTIEWSLLLGGTESDIPTAMTFDGDGNTYVVARSQSNHAGLQPNQGGFDVWVIKINNAGEVEWQQSFGGAGNDAPTDIEYHPLGFVYVVVQSNSDDADFDQNEGINDLWLLRLDSDDGDPVSFSHYGGTGNEFDGHLDLFGLNNLVVSASTTSADVDVTGNKGLSDVWVILTDLEGDMVQQMNYGGMNNDYAADILVVDSIIHVFNTSFSTDKNVPSNALFGSDQWYFTIDLDPDACSDQFSCLLDTIYTNVLFPPDNEALTCITGCNAGLGPGPDFLPGVCMDFVHPTAFFRITTDTFSDLLTVSVNSFEFNEPRIALFRSTTCTTFNQVSCETGSYGNVVMSYVNIQPLTTYWVAVSDATGNVGGFEICATTVDVEFCNEGDRIFVNNTSMGSPPEGPFQPGEEVQICYELYDWEKLDCNGFQGLLPTFGPGWDSLSFNLFGMPIQMDTFLMPATDGIWDWHQVGEVHYNISNPINGYDGGQGMPAGWYFTNTTDPPPADNPDQTTGDIDNCLPTPDKWKVCFTLTVTEECVSHLDCSVTMKTFGDGELGIDPGLACVYDQAEEFHAIMQCCLNSSIQNIQNFSICSGDTIKFKPQTNLLFPALYSWTADPDPFIVGATDGNMEDDFFQVLHTQAAIPLTVMYTIYAQGGGCFTNVDGFEVTVLPLPGSQISSTGPTSVCSGSTVTLNFLSTGTPPFQIGLFRDNQPFGNILSESNFISIEVDPVFSSRFRIGTLEDAFCEGTGTGFVDITVKPNSTLVVDTLICEGESIMYGNMVYDESGVFMVELPGQAENNCDSTILIMLNVIPSITDTIQEVICNGDTLFVLEIPYTETTNEIIEYLGSEGCPNYIHLDLLVKDTFSMEIDQTICFGDSLEFGGVKVFQEGTYSHTVEIRPGCFEQTVLHLDVLPAIVINDVAILDDDGNGNGAIILEIVGGATPYMFKWDSGQTTESIFSIMHGEYELTVTDNNGCMETFTFTVPFVSSTSEINAGAKVHLRPNPVRPGDPIFLYTDGRSPLSVSALLGYTVEGIRYELSQKQVIDPGAALAVDIPSAFTQGLYYLLVQLESGERIPFRFLIQ